jgi:hypothetical protein
VGRSHVVIIGPADGEGMTDLTGAVASTRISGL